MVLISGLDSKIEVEWSLGNGAVAVDGLGQEDVGVPARLGAREDALGCRGTASAGSVCAGRKREGFRIGFGINWIVENGECQE